MSVVNNLQTFFKCYGFVFHPLSRHAIQLVSCDGMMYSCDDKNLFFLFSLLFLLSLSLSTVSAAAFISASPNVITAIVGLPLYNIIYKHYCLRTILYF